MRLLLSILTAVFLCGGFANAYEAKDMEKFLSEDSYPTAAQCAGCHQQIYNEWASSNHAYASISPNNSLPFHKLVETQISLKISKPVSERPSIQLSPIWRAELI